MVESIGTTGASGGTIAARVPYSSKVDGAYRALRDYILAGEIAPGTHLNQAKLAEDLQFSATPLREAVQRLEAEGLVRVRAHRDVIVTPVEVGEVKSIFALRGRLDEFSIRVASHHLTEGSKTAIASAAEDLELWRSEPVVADRTFHRAVYTTTGNHVLISQLDSLWDRTDRYHHVFRQPTIAAFHEDHRSMALALMSGNIENAVQEMRRHVDMELEAIVVRAQVAAEDSSS